MLTALIDGDILAYEMGSLTKKEPEKGEEEFLPHLNVGDLLPFEICFGSVERKIQEIVDRTGADDYRIYLSCPEIKTWRYEVATILPYKGKRENKEKPAHWQTIRTNLEIHHPCEVVPFMEADDALSITQYEDLHLIAQDSPEFLPEDMATTVICSRDKDLNMVPGFHYGWGTSRTPEKALWWQDELSGLKCFYTQLLTGDPTDNILGLYRIGPKAACVQKIQDCVNEGEMFRNVYAEYVARFGSYAKQFMLETGQLLWMQRTKDDRWNPWDEGKVEGWDRAAEIS